MEEFLTNLFSHGPFLLYLATLVVLLLCGIGVPIPEEATFLAAGFACATVGGDVWILCIIGVFGILVGDSLAFFVGRRYGNELLSHRYFKRVLTPERLERTRQFFRKRGSRTVFMARFVAGLRMPTFFMAGTMGVSYGSFVFYDLLGALISCPTSIWLAYRYGEPIREFVANSNLAITGIIVGVVALVLLKHWRSAKHTDAQPPQPPALVDAPVRAPICKDTSKIEKAAIAGEDARH